MCYRQAQHYETGKYDARLSEYSLNIYSSTISENRIIKYPPGKKMNYFSFSLAYLSGQWINYKSLLLLPVLWRKKVLNGRLYVRAHFRDAGNLANDSEPVINDSSAANASRGRQGPHCFTLQFCGRYKKNYSKFMHSTYILHTVI